VTLPFDIHAFQMRTETTTRFLDPLSDGFARDSYFDWHNAEHTIAFWDAAKGALCAVNAVDAHAFEHFNTIAFTSWPHTNALLLSRLEDRTDEYQFADGSIGPYTIEPGAPTILKSTHVIRGSAPGFDPAAASRFGFEALNALETRLLTHRPGNLPGATASFFSIDPPGTLLYTVKNADDGDGLIFRMTELTGAATTASLTSQTFALSGPEIAPQSENPGGTPLGMSSNAVAVPLQPYQTATVRVRVAPSWAPITLFVDKDAASGAVKLHWTGGVAPYTVDRADDAAFTSGLATPDDEQSAPAFDDYVLGDGVSHFYLVK